MSRIASSFLNFRDRIRTSISVKSQNFLFFAALFLLVFLAIMIRLTPILRGALLIKAFDPWIQYYNAEYLSTHTLYEYYHWYDYKSWYPEGYTRGELRPGLTFSVVIIYQFFNFLGIPVSLYHVCYFFPAFMGGLTVLAAYFLGKEVLNRECGLFTAFFLAFNTGHIQRTTAGFFDNETIGVLFTLLTFLFFLKALHNGKISHSIIGGMFLGLLSLSWGGYSYVFLLLPIICGILILMNKYNENVLISYAGVQGTALFLRSLFFGFNHNELLKDFDTMIIFLFTIVLIIFHLIHAKKNNYPRLFDGFVNFLKWSIIPGAVIVAIIIWVNPDLIPLGIGGRLKTVLSPLIRSDFNLTASVAEHQPSAWSVFYYNTLIPLILLPLGIFFCFKRSAAADVFTIAFLLTLFYFTGSMIRIILLFAPAASLMGAYGLVNVLKIYGSFLGERKASTSRKRRRQVKRTVGNSEIFAVYFIVGFLCISQVAHATDISVNQLSYSQIVINGQFHDWEETLTWMKTNLPGTAVVASWWDYGYWLTPIGNATTVNDNATINGTRIGLTGMALMQSNEIYSAKAFRNLKADYVLVFFGYLISGFSGDEGKWHWMVRICNDGYENYKRMGMEEDNWAENSVFDENEYMNSSTGTHGDKWFESQLVRMMFYGVPTTNIGYPSSSLIGNYISQINSRKDTDGNTWKSHIPDEGAYDFKVFQKEYFSSNGLVKLYKIDYTALDSSFSINDAEVFDSGYSTFKLQNTGTRDLIIKNVRINNQNCNFTMSKSPDNNKLNDEDQDIVWVDLGSTDLNRNDVVNITVSAQADALKGKTFTFNETTSNFLVTEAKEGAIKINRENSKVVQENADKANLYLEVENIGGSIELLNKYYVNTEQNLFNKNTTEYITGSSILKPGEKAYVYLPDAPATFSPIGTNNKIGVVTSNGIKDETLFSSNYENFKISILNETRIISSEVLATSDDSFKKHIPVNLSKTYAIIDDNGYTTININVKNTGSTVLGLDTIDLTKSESWDTIYGDFILDPGQEDTIIMKTSEPNLFDENDEIAISVTASFDGSTIASDIGYTHAIRNKPDILIIKNVDTLATSLIAADETGKLLIKNTGNVPITLDKIYLNDTTDLLIDNDVEFVHGDATLDMQECAIITFNIPDLKINMSDKVKVNVTTNTLAEYSTNFTAEVNSLLYNITIDDDGTSADISVGEVIIKILSGGTSDVTLDSIYINDTYIPLANFTITVGTSYMIGNSGEFITIEIKLDEIEVALGVGVGTITAEDKLKILARTKEGAEFTYIVTVRD